MSTVSGLAADPSVYQQLGLTTKQETDKASAQLAQEDFLELMITELKYQDPFNPMENAEMASQFASFSTVTGIAELSNSFSDLSSTLTASQSLAAANLIGRDVEVESNKGQLETGQDLEGKVRLDASATDVQVAIYSKSGELMRTLELGSQETGEVAFTWDGLTTQGAQAPAGEYKIVAQAKVDGKVLTQKTLIAAPVDSVALNGENGIQVNVKGVGPVNFDQISAIG